MDTNIKVEPLGLQTMPETNSSVPEKLPVLVTGISREGIDAIVSTISFLATAGEALHNSLQDDGKISLLEYASFIPAIVALPGFVTSLNSLGRELSDEITPEEKEYILSELKKHSQFLGDEEMVLDAADLAIDMKNFIFKYFIKK